MQKISQNPKSQSHLKSSQRMKTSMITTVRSEKECKKSSMMPARKAESKLTLKFTCKNLASTSTWIGLIPWQRKSQMWIEKNCWRELKMKTCSTKVSRLILVWVWVQKQEHSLWLLKQSLQARLSRLKVKALNVKFTSQICSIQAQGQSY